MVELTLVFKGKSEKVELADGASSDSIFDAAREKFSLEDQNLKLLCKGKQLQPDSELPAGGAQVTARIATGDEPTCVRAGESLRALAERGSAAQGSHQPMSHAYSRKTARMPSFFTAVSNIAR